VDDRSGTVARRVRNANASWIPYVVVVGPREACGKLRVRKRENGSVGSRTLRSLVEEIGSRLGGYPKRPLPYPKLLSRRPAY